MATALTAWFRAPAPTTWTSTAPDCRTTPAMAPATELGFERLDTLRISTGPPDGRDLSVPGRFDSAVDASCPPIRPFCGRFVPHTLRGRNRAARRRFVGRSVQRDGLIVRVGAILGGLRTLGRLRRRGQAHLLTDAPVDVDHDLEVLGEEGLGVLPALAELFALVGEPGPGLLHQPEIDADVDQRAFTADALAISDVELCLAERRRALVLHDLHPRAVADHLDAVLDRFDAPDVEPDR